MKINSLSRRVDGVLLLDKPRGPSSNGVLQQVKNLFRAKKAGHTGSLDPQASGMLPICLGEATKFAQFLLTANKHYRVTGKLGETTASGDGETEVTRKRAVGNLTVQQIEQQLSQFRGAIFQIPPMFSALKHRGKPLYKLARLGIEVERQPRLVQILKLELVELQGELLTLELVCSKGTYVRTLITDLGEALQCGAHVVDLRRLAVGNYCEEQLVTLDRIEKLVQREQWSDLERLLLPVESMLAGLPQVKLTEDMWYYAGLGNILFIPRTSELGLVSLYRTNGNFCGVGELIGEGRLVPRRLYGR